jgi:hypothetical protein
MPSRDEILSVPKEELRKRGKKTTSGCVKERRELRLSPLSTNTDASDRLVEFRKFASLVHLEPHTVRQAWSVFLAVSHGDPG